MAWGDLTARLRSLERRMSGPERAVLMISRADYLDLLKGGLLKVRVPSVGLLGVAIPTNRDGRDLLREMFESPRELVQAYYDQEKRLKLRRVPVRSLTS